MRRAARLRAAFFPELLPDDFAARLDPLEDLFEVPLPFGLGTGRDLLGDGSLLGVDLPGHALGHFGVLYPNVHPPLLYAVDVQWLSAAVLQDRLPRGPLRLIYADAAAVARSTERVRRLVEAGGQARFCHEPIESA